MPLQNVAVLKHHNNPAAVRRSSSIRHVGSLPTGYATYASPVDSLADFMAFAQRMYLWHGKRTLRTLLGCLHSQVPGARIEFLEQDMAQWLHMTIDEVASRDLKLNQRIAVMDFARAWVGTVHGITPQYYDALEHIVSAADLFNALLTVVSKDAST